MGIRTRSATRSRTAGDRPSNSAPSSSARRSADPSVLAARSRSIAPGAGVRATSVNPAARNTSRLDGHWSSIANGMKGRSHRGADRLPHRGSTQPRPRMTPLAPNAAAQRKMPPTLSAFVTPSSTSACDLGAWASSHPLTSVSGPLADCQTATMDVESGHVVQRILSDDVDRDIRPGVDDVTERCESARSRGRTASRAPTPSAAVGPRGVLPR